MKNSTHKTYVVIGIIFCLAFIFLLAETKSLCHRCAKNQADILDLQKVSVKQQQDIERLRALVVHPKECAEGRI